MASPFFSSYWNQPSESRYSPSSIPLKRKPETASPKVISIPVHFVGSENNRINSSVRIQKVFRGFFVRKSVNRIVSIKNQVEEIERRMAKNETVELIRKDSKERLRINETLMALLFKLDSVRGIDTGVRDLRKGVIRKAIALQEKVDALPVENEAAGDSIKSDGGEIVDDHPICGDEMPIENSPAVDEMSIENVVVDFIKFEGGEIVDDHPICDSIKSDGGDDHPICDDEMPIENSPIENVVVDFIKSEGGEIVDDHPICVDELPIQNSPIENVDDHPICDDDENSPGAVSIDEMPIENVVDSIDQEIVEECNTMNSKTEIRKEDEEMDDCCTGVQQSKEEETGEVRREDDEKMISEEAGEKKSNEELQTQMIRMMSEILEKNEMQTRMINSLTHRVAQLEKAFLCDILRRSNKKKKRHHDAAADGKQQ